MALQPVLAVLLLSALALAGCSGDDGGGGDGTSSSTSGTGTGSASGTTTARPNQPPTADLTVTVNGTSAAFRLNGTDPDNGTLTWSLDFGDGASENGTGLPANVTHAYVEGTFAANLTVSDGKANATDAVSVVVAAAAPTLGQAATMAWDVGVTDQESVTAGPAFLDCADGPNKTFNYDSFELDTATVGLPFKATISDATSGAGIRSWTLYFNLEDCSDYSGTFSAEGAAEITGTIPEGSSAFAFAMATGGFLLEVQFMSGSQIV